MKDNNVYVTPNSAFAKQINFSNNTGTRSRENLLKGRSRPISGTSKSISTSTLSPYKLKSLNDKSPFSGKAKFKRLEKNEI